MLPEEAAALLDLEHLNRFGHNPQGLREVIDAFLQTTEPILDALERVAHQQNETEFRQILHALIGAANSAGARALADGCRTLARLREPEQRATTLRDLAVCFQQTHAVLTAFSNTLPAETGRSAPIDGSRKTLLIVEDNASARAVLHALLADEYALLDAETGETALRLCAGARRPDAAIVDLNLGRSQTACSGLEVLKRLHGQIPAIVLTVDRSRDSMRAAIQAGAWAYLIKPPEPDRLFAAVEAALARADDRTDPTTPRALDLATGLIMAAHHLDPPEAQRLITTQAMAQRRKPADVAADIVAMQCFDNRMARAARSLIARIDESPS